ncbi:MAG: secretin and TonB N-terminal domain-containing protein [Deltaproteobacteria bacterium]|nr:secretin and TonB N-terminal domain-containing protein [Deltaproteobacteria bacterium]
MKRKKFLPVIPYIIVVMIFLGCAGSTQKDRDIPLTAASEKTSEATTQDQAGCNLEGMTFERMTGKERISFLLSKVSGFDITRESGNSILVKLADTYASEKLRTKQGEGLLENVQYLLPMQKTVNGMNWVYVQIYLNQMVPYRIREDINGYIVDFDVSMLPETDAKTTAKQSYGEKSASTMKTFELISQDMEADQAETAKAGETKKYTGNKIALLSFQNAQIKSVLRSISEYSGYNIVSGPDVTGTVTIHMKDVPWDQALDTILEINSLGKKQFGDVITVLPLEKLKKAEEEQLKKDASQGKLKQISIEAKIVEVSTNAARKLGINWGAGYQTTWNNRDIGALMGSSASGNLTTLPNGVGLTSSNIAVNFPGTTGADVITPGLGIILGGGSWILDAQLSALETSGEGKIISSPKVTTLDNVKATIKQGEEIPYATIDNQGNRSISFKDAVLQLDVKPTITEDGKISMTVKATNDYADWNKTNTSNENPPIITSNVESTIVVQDGDTLVVGGIFKTTQSEAMSGVPGLSKIPLLGWLFKYKTYTQEKRELLIFITPRIIKES